MRIGIDARFLGSASKGLGRYTEQLVRNLEREDTENEYRVFLRKENWSAWNPVSAKWKKVLADFRWYSIEEQVSFPGVLRREKCDVYHFPHFNVPLFAPAPYVVTIHDLILSHFPTKKASTLGPVLYWFKHAMYKTVLRRALTRAEHIIAVSAYTSKDIQQSYGVDTSKITVTYEGVDQLSAPGVDTSRVLSRYGISSPYLLYVGNAYPHKNLERLVTAFKKIQTHDPELSLVLVGKHDYFYRRLIRFVKNNGIPRVLFPGFVPDEHLGEIFANATLYVFPSLYEGFGLPPLEALAQGTPVASSHASCLPEILGEAAAYFSPHDTDDIVQVVLRVLQNPDMQKQIVEKGRNQVRRYSWSNMARETHSVYANVYESAKTT